MLHREQPPVLGVELSDCPKGTSTLIKSRYLFRDKSLLFSTGTKHPHQLPPLWFGNSARRWEEEKNPKSDGSRHQEQDFICRALLQTQGMWFTTEQPLGGPCERNQENLTQPFPKKHLQISPSSSQLGGKEKKSNNPTFLHGSCGNGTSNLCFFCGLWAKKRVLCAATGSNPPQGGGEQECLGPEENSPTFYPAAPRDQHLLMFLEKSMVWWITNELKRAPAGRETGIFCLTVSLSCSSQKCCTGLTWC